MSEIMNENIMEEIRLEYNKTHTTLSKEEFAEKWNYHKSRGEDIFGRRIGCSNKIIDLGVQKYIDHQASNSMKNTWLIQNLDDEYNIDFDGDEVVLTVPREK